MPSKPRKLCSYPGCQRLCTGRRCEEHAIAAWSTTKGSAHSRGYGASWRKLRESILARDPVCRLCGRVWSVTVDHVVPKAAGGSDDDSNLQGLCDACHVAKTGGDAQAGKGRQRRGRRGEA